MEKNEGFTITETFALALEPELDSLKARLKGRRRFERKLQVAHWIDSQLRIEFGPNIEKDTLRKMRDVTLRKISALKAQRTRDFRKSTLVIVIQRKSKRDIRTRKKRPARILLLSRLETFLARFAANEHLVPIDPDEPAEDILGLDPTAFLKHHHIH